MMLIDYTSTFFYNISGGNFWIMLFGASFVVSLCCLPFYLYAEYLHEQERAIQDKMKTKVENIKKTFKGSQKYMMLSTYYKQNGYHPIMGLRCSFSLLLQIPFFIAAYIYFSHLPLFEGQALWFINDLSKPDSIITIGSFPINICPVIMTIINIIAGQVYTTEMTMNEKVQLYLMSLFFLVLLYFSPSGLVIYWTFNNIFSLVKNIIVNLFHFGKQPAAVTVEVKND